MKGIRTAEIERFIKAYGSSPEYGIIKVLEQLSERQSALEQNMQENGMILLQMSKMMAQITDGAGAMRDKIETMQGKEGDNDLPPAHG